MVYEGFGGEQYMSGDGWGSLEMKGSYSTLENIVCRAYLTKCPYTKKILKPAMMERKNFDHEFNNLDL